MADVVISDLSPITPSTGLVLPVSNGSSTGKVTLSQVCGVMTSAQIATALGFTPASAASPLIARAWGFVEATAIVLSAGVNVASVSRPNNGQYLITLNPGTTNCLTASIIALPDQGTANGVYCSVITGTRTADSFRIAVQRPSDNGAMNGYDFSFVVFGA